MVFIQQRLHFMEFSHAKLLAFLEEFNLPTLNWGKLTEWLHICICCLDHLLDIITVIYIANCYVFSFSEIMILIFFAQPSHNRTFKMPTGNSALFSTCAVAFSETPRHRDVLRICFHSCLPWQWFVRLAAEKCFSWRGGNFFCGVVMSRRKARQWKIQHVFDCEALICQLTWNLFLKFCVS